MQHRSWSDTPRLVYSRNQKQLSYIDDCVESLTVELAENYKTEFSQYPKLHPGQ